MLFFVVINLSHSDKSLLSFLILIFKYHIAKNFGNKKTLADLTDETSSANVFSANYFDYSKYGAN